MSHVGPAVPALLILVAVGFGGIAVADVAADEPSIERSFNDTTPDPGETVEVTVTFNISEEVAIDLVDDYEPAFESGSFVGTYENGEPVFPTLQEVLSDVAIVTLDEVGPGTIEFVYHVEVADNATTGTTHEFNDTAQVNETAVSVDGPSEVVVGGSGGAFDVQFTDVPASVTAGEELTAGYEVENTGDLTDTQNLTVAVNGTEHDSTTVTLDPDETFTDEFSYVTDADDIPSVDLAVSSANDSASETVAVEEAGTPTFAVEIADGSDDEVVAGETATVEAVVENVGDESGTQELTFAVNGTEHDSTTVTLDAGEDEQVTFGYETNSGDVPGVETTVSSANETASHEVGVVEAAEFVLDSVDVPDAVVAGETVTVGYVLENVGDGSGTQTVTVAANGTEHDSTTVTLDPEETFAGTFNYVTDSGDVPAVAFEVSSEDDSASETVTVEEAGGPTFAVEIADGSDDEVVAGETLTVEAVVENTGEVSGTRELAFAVNGTEHDNTTVTLDAGEDERVTFSYETDTGDVPGVETTVSSANETASHEVGVVEAAEFVIDSVDVPDAVVAGETATVEYVLENVGGGSGTQTVTVAVNGTEESSTAVTLDADETFTDELSYETDAGDVPAVEFEVATANDSASETVAVEEAGTPTFAVEIAEDSEDEVVAGETATVEAVVENVGEESGTQEIAFGVNGTEHDSTTVTLDAGEDERVTFDYETDTGDVPGVETTVSSANETASHEVGVTEAESEFTLELGVPAEVTAGETLTVTYQVTNTGTGAGTQEVVFTVADESVDSESVTLDPGGTADGEFSYETDAEDPPSVALSVTTDDATSTDEVTVAEAPDPASFTVSVGAPDDARAGENITVAAVVENVGGETGSTTVALSANGTEVASETVTLDPAATETVQFEYATETDDRPAVAFAASAGDETSETTLTVADDADGDGAGFGAVGALGALLVASVGLWLRRLYHA